MTKNIYVLDSYNKIIKWKMEQNLEQWGLLSAMAEAAHCQKSHMSRVLSHKVDLTLEQARGLCTFFKLDENESEYFLTLVELARAGTPELRQRFEKRIKLMRVEQEDLSKRLKKSNLGAEEKELLFYSAWYWTAIHILATIPEYQTLKAMAKKLSLTEDFVLHCLKLLEGYGLVRKENDRWIHNSSSFHVSKKSPLVSLHHSNWRARAVLDAQNPLNENLHFTVVQSISRQDYENLKQLFLNTIDEYNKIASPSQEEELICFCLDFFIA